MRKLGNSLEINKARIRVAEGFKIDELRVFPDRVFEVFRISGISESDGDTSRGEGVAQQIEGAAIDAQRRSDVISGLRDISQSRFDSRCTACQGECRIAAFQRGIAPFENILCGVGQTPVNIAWIAEREACFGMIEIMEDITCCRMDRHAPGICGRICFLLPDMQPQGFKMIFFVVVSTLMTSPS